MCVYVVRACVYVCVCVCADMYECMLVLCVVFVCVCVYNKLIFGK